MPPKAAPSGSDATFNGEVASANDIKFMLSLVTNLQSKPDVNWDALAAALSLSKKCEFRLNLKLAIYQWQKPSLLILEGTC